MENWRKRAKDAGLSQRQIAKLCGIHENTVSRQLSGEWEVPRYVISVIVAWELMTHEQRIEWVQSHS